MTDNFKIGDIAVFKDQTHNMIERSLSGGIVVMVGNAVVFLKRHGRGIMSYDKEELRLLKPEDVKEPGIEIL